jgi:hypothetical protein
MMRNDKPSSSIERETSNASTAEEALKNEERSLDIGESGQFAPGGYYNQQGVNAPRRIDLDDDVTPPARGAHKDRT